jgi:hypothetical protein
MRLSSVSFRRLLEILLRSVARETKGERREIFPITASEEKTTRALRDFRGATSFCLCDPVVPLRYLFCGTSSPAGRCVKLTTASILHRRRSTTVLHVGATATLLLAAHSDAGRHMVTLYSDAAFSVKVARFQTLHTVLVLAAVPSF